MQGLLLRVSGGFVDNETMGAETELHEKLEEERPRPTLTPEQFLSWKRQKDAAASARKAEISQKRAEDIAAGTVQMNGRELFMHEPWVFDNSQTVGYNKDIDEPPRPPPELSTELVLSMDASSLDSVHDFEHDL
ncbi:hypothetical protein RJT34_12122 [Clitoria ternatea]|uniref:ZC3H15/TMA46 family C-terminal domain-containing protein n=1 Tax=Clitoria ternatea TaxID=43366 RepID=A0AAN9JNB3_CLITE